MSRAEVRAEAHRRRDALLTRITRRKEIWGEQYAWVKGTNSHWTADEQDLDFFASLVILILEDV